MANEVIGNNKGQIEKKLFTDNAEGEKIKLVRTMTDNDEGKMVADAIQELKLRDHFHNRDCAILYRTNAQSRSFEEALRRMGIVYRIYGGISFYQRKEVKDFPGLPAPGGQSKRRGIAQTDHQLPGAWHWKNHIGQVGTACQPAWGQCLGHSLQCRDVWIP